jgi:hypothetical protein
VQGGKSSATHARSSESAIVADHAVWRSTRHSERLRLPSASQTAVYEAGTSASEELSLFVKLRYPSLITRDVKTRLVAKEGPFLQALHKHAEKRSGMTLAALNLDIS